jgi:hypothetical protein
MKDKAIKNLTLALLIFVGVVLVYFFISTAIDGYCIWSKNKIDFAVTGQFGDFIGGFLGTIINGAAFYFLYLTLNEQRKSSLKLSFETKLYELVRLHRENISELRYTKFHKDSLKTSESRKVFRVIVQEFIDCYHETKHFSKIYPDLEIIKPAYKIELKKIIKRNKCKVAEEDLALIDIAFCFFYFGVSKESEPILLHKFYNRYNKEFTNRCKVFLQLKPKEENLVLFNEWKIFKEKKVIEKSKLFEEIYPNAGKSNLPTNCNKHVLYDNLAAEKYYGGHQHRLGHYFRHLFQTYKFLSSQDYLSPDEKYFYGKTIRAQLSTYEQLLILFNSLCSLGMKWEYTADIDPIPKNKVIDDFKFITRYNIIKNLPGSQYYDFTYRQYYPKVRFEYMEDITYSRRISNIPD